MIINRQPFLDTQEMKILAFFIFILLGRFAQMDAKGLADQEHDFLQSSDLCFLFTETGQPPSVECRTV